VEPAPAQQAATDQPCPDGRLHPAGWVDQVARREAFEAAHPSVKIQPHVLGQPWTAVVPMPDGGKVTVTELWELGSLLDKLESLFSANDLAARSGDGW
jgi:hypothetical protein